MEIGKLGIFHLKELWEKNVLGINMEKNKNHLNQLICDGLEIGIMEVIGFLQQNKPSFSDFENWILEKKNGFIDNKLKEKINNGVLTYLKENHPTYPLKLNIKKSIFTKEDWKCWEENGYIVLKNAISREDCKTLEDAIWQYLKMSPDEPNGWNLKNEIFWISNFKHPTVDKNRSSKRIHQAFTEVWGTKELFHSNSRVSFNPPFNNEYNQYGPSNLHWDASIAKPMTFDVIGLLYLNDVAENQGAFQCVPGFHHKIGEWIKSLPEGVNPRDEIIDAFESVKISGSAGDLIICRQELPHGSSINLGNYPRFVQYISMYPADRGINPIWE